MSHASEPRRRLALGTSAALCFLAAASCDRTVHVTEVLPPLDAASVDADAGAWRMIVLTGPEQVAVAAPAAAASDAYRTELETLKQNQARLTTDQRRAIDYWGGGGVLRWNQILRELVARYNLPPAPRADGSYPVPDAENPFGETAFPFANPPYAARAYAYVAVAQYEALKAAWYWKYKYARPSPARVDNAVRALVPVSDLPAYPSEDAVLAGVTAEVLKLMFPGAVEDVTRQAAAEREAALLSGRATASDVAAGLALGRAVAALVVARARADGTGNASGNVPAWRAYEASATRRGEVAWLSQELPARPPMLMNFGNVQTFAMSRADMIAAEAAPPSTSSPQFKADLAEVRYTVAHLTTEQRAIAQKWNDGAGTYTPPGHWNDIAAEYVRDARMSEVRAARTFAVLNMAMHDVAVACWDNKYRYFNPRPTQMDPAIKTVIGLPNFPAYPSGHSTFSAAAATVLSSIFPQGASSFGAMADEAGVSRLYGGIHYRSDIEGGKTLGTRVGQAVLKFTSGDGAR